MSSFLDKFNNDKYEDFLEEESKHEKEVAKTASEDEIEVSEEVDDREFNNEDILEDQQDVDEVVEENTKSETFINDVGPTRGNQEEVEIDTTFKKKKKKQRLILIGVSIAVLVSFGLTWFFINRVKVPDFVGKTYAEVTKWSQENKIKLDVSNTYSKEYDENIVVEQEKKEKSGIMKGSTMAIVVSNGADPEELVKLPDFSKKRQVDIEAWIKVNKMKNVTVAQEFSKDIPKGEYIKTTIKDTKVTAESFKRKDYAIISISKGEEIFEKNIEVPKFKDKSKSEVEEWAKKNQVVAEFVNEASNSVSEGSVISQSVAAGEKVAKNDTVSFAISSGKAVIIPNYYNYNSETAANAGPNVTVEVKEVYSDSVAYGYLISQSHPAGAVYAAKDDIKVQVVYSLGLPYIDNLIGMQEKDLQKTFFGYQSKGAMITFDTYYSTSSCPKGTIVDASKYSQYTGLRDHVNIYISNGRGSSCSVDTRTGE